MIENSFVGLASVGLILAGVSSTPLKASMSNLQNNDSSEVLTVRSQNPTKFYDVATIVNKSYSTIVGKTDSDSTFEAEHCSITYRCQHGEFTLSGFLGTNEGFDKVCSRQLTGDRVEINYFENNLSSYEDRDGDGKKELVQREISDLSHYSKGYFLIRLINSSSQP